MQSERVWVPGHSPSPGLVRDAHPVWLCLLGSVRLLRYGQPVALRHGGKTEALLARLGVASRPGLARETLLRSLWPDSELALAATALNNIVDALRGLLGDALSGASPVVHTAGYYRLNHEAGVTVDVSYFRRLAAQSEQHARRGEPGQAAELAEQAVGLYGGHLNLGGRRGAQASFERDQLRAICLGLLARLADSAFERGAFELAQGYARRLLASDPAREDAHRLVLRCYARQGERTQALRYYQTVQAVLAAEFEAVPEPATARLAEQIRRDPSAV